MLTIAASWCHMQHVSGVHAIAKLETDTSMAGMHFSDIPCMHKLASHLVMTGACTLQSLLMRRVDN